MSFMKKTKNSKTGDKWLIGIDEVGRGPLAGPVTVGAVAVLVNRSNAVAYSKLRKKLMEISGIKYPIGIDSKKMKEIDRDFWYEVICKLVKREDLYAVVSSTSAEMIDKKGIAVCIKDLVNTNLKKLSKKSKFGTEGRQNSEDIFSQMDVLLDGGLKTSLTVGSQKTIIKGDEKELLISLASVFAKVTRDRHMKKLSKNHKYAHYGFDVHKGYGTVLHRSVIKKVGLSKEHRRSFCKNIFD
jgi:ribonuclease HII